MSPVLPTMQTTYTATVAVEPIPCPRPRVMARGKFAHAYYPASYKTWRAAFIKALPEVTRKFTRRVDLVVEFVCSKARTSKLETPKGDIDNYLKSLMDSLTDAELWIDDKQVASVTCSKRFAEKGEAAGITFTATETSWLSNTNR